MKYFLTINKTINFLFIFSLASIIIKILYLDDIPELFKLGHEFGEMYSRLCLSYISSYIFYFVVVHIKKEKDKKNINKFINSKIRTTYSQWKPQLMDICKAAGIDMPSDLPEKAFIIELFSNINPNSQAPLIKNTQGNYANWIEYFFYYKNRVDKFISVVTDKMPFLDSELVRLLSELSECEHFKMVEATVALAIKNQDLSAWASGFHEYCIKSYDLEAYANKFHLK